MTAAFGFSHSCDAIFLSFVLLDLVSTATTMPKSVRSRIRGCLSFQSLLLWYHTHLRWISHIFSEVIMRPAGLSLLRQVLFEPEPQRESALIACVKGTS